MPSTAPITQQFQQNQQTREIRRTPRASGEQRSAPPSPAPRPQPVHSLLICVALPGLAISSMRGRLAGRGLEGIYQAGRRLLSRCSWQVAGAEPLMVQGRLCGAARARFVGTVRTAGDTGPDPEIRVERLLCADGTDRVTFHSSAPRGVRLPVEVALGTDLAELGAVAVGRPGPELPAGVHGGGLRWSAPGAQAILGASPPPEDTMASAGLLRWELDLPPGARRTIELRVRLEHMPYGEGPGRSVPASSAGGGAAPFPAHPIPRAPGARTAPPVPSVEGARRAWSPGRLRCDDSRADALMSVSLDDLRALLSREPGVPARMYLAGGVPWRCGFAPAEALWSARMLLPLGTRLAADTLHAVADVQLSTPGAEFGRVRGVLRDAGPGAPPSCTGVEATLLFPTVLAEARRWGLPERDVERLLPTAERCLEWARTAAGRGTGGGCGYVPDPSPGGPYRCETQAHAHRAALLGAGLLEDFGRPGATALRDWGAALRERFHADFWVGDRGGGCPAALRTADGRRVARLGSDAAHLLDTGLLGEGEYAVGLLDKVDTQQLARRLGGPALDSGWGLRSLGAKESGYNPFGHRSGAVRVHETAVAVAGLAVAGHEKEAGALARGLLDASEEFGHRLPEMFAGEQRADGGAPVPHPAACRPAATAAAGAVAALISLAGIRPDVPAGTVAIRPVGSAPLGALEFTGLSVAEAPFAVRVSRLGLGLVEEAADGLQLGT